MITINAPRATALSYYLSFTYKFKQVFEFTKLTVP